VGRARVKAEGVSVAVECDAYALCSDVLALGWTAAIPCRGCVTSGADDSVRAETAERRTADPAPAVTADELERLLCRARQRKNNTATS
jgi:hypothetical protein